MHIAALSLLSPNITDFQKHYSLAEYAYNLGLFLPLML